MILSTRLKDKGMPKGNTVEGSAWLMKALHPADNQPPWAGVPTGESEPTVVMEYEAVTRIVPNAAAVGSWVAYLNMLPNPVQPLSALSTDSVGDLSWGLINPSFYESGGSSAVSKLRDVATHWRMTHMAITAELDAPALSNQGSVVSAQIPWISQKLNASWINLVDAPVAGDVGRLIVARHIEVVDQDQNQIGYERLAAKPLSYSGLAKDGVYQVLKIDPHTPFQPTWDTTTLVPKANSAAGGAYGISRSTLIPKTTYNDIFPFYRGNLPAADRFIGTFINPSVQWQLSGSESPGMPQPLFGRTCFYNMSVAAALTIRVRWGVEYLVHPTSVLAPAMKPAVPLDELALATYCRMAAVEPDAYPASYNSWDDLSKFLRKIYTSIKPTLSFLTAAPGPVGLVAGGVRMLGDAIEESLSSRDAERPAVVTPMQQAASMTIRTKPKKDGIGKKKARVPRS